MRRTFVAAMLCALLLVACGGGSLSLTEYSEEVAALITRVDNRLDALAAEIAAAPPNVAAAQAYFDARVAGYRELVDGVEGLDPPDEVTWIRAELRTILAGLLAAEEDRAVFASTLESVDELDLAWEGEEAKAIRTAELMAIELCYVAQEQIDATGDRESLRGVAWIPDQMKEVVLVSFGCPEAP